MLGLLTGPARRRADERINENAILQFTPPDFSRNDKAYHARFNVDEPAPDSDIAVRYERNSPTSRGHGVLKENRK